MKPVRSCFARRRSAEYVNSSGAVNVDGSTCRAAADSDVAALSLRGQLIQHFRRFQYVSREREGRWSLRSPSPLYGEEWCQVGRRPPPRRAGLHSRRLGVSEAGTPVATHDRISRPLFARPAGSAGLGRRIGPLLCSGDEMRRLHELARPRQGNWSLLDSRRQPVDEDNGRALFIV